MESNQSSMVQAMQAVAPSAPVRRIESTELRPDSPGSRRSEPAPALLVEPAVRVDLSSQAKAIAAGASRGLSAPAQSIEQQITVRKAEFTEQGLIRAARADQNANQAQEAMSMQRMQELAQKEKVQALMQTETIQPKKEVPIQQGNLYD